MVKAASLAVPDQAGAVDHGSAPYRGPPATRAPHAAATWTVCRRSEAYAPALLVGVGQGPTAVLLEAMA